MKFLSLFAGIGGFDLGFEMSGMSCIGQVERDHRCIVLLSRYWPHVHKEMDVRNVSSWTETANIVCGGDPCPSRSLAKGNRESKHPDLSGYFLAVAARLRPWWVVRENVPAPDAIDFATGLEAIGYGVTAFALDARDFTGQSRRREFVIGGLGSRAADFQRILFDRADGFGFSASRSEEETPVAACVTAHPARMAAEDSYVFEAITYCLAASSGDQWEGGNYLYDGGRLRNLTPEECEGLQGFPRGWTSGFSRSRRRIMLGNAVPVPFARFIGRIVNTVEDEDRTSCAPEPPQDTAEQASTDMQRAKVDIT